MADVLSVGVNLEAFAQAISAIQALRSSVSRVFDCLKDGMRNKETLEGREKAFIAHFQDNLHSVNRDLNELERLSNLVGKPSENHPLHNSGLLSLDPVQDKTPLYSQLLQAYKWSNKGTRVRSQVREDTTCRGAAKPVRHTTEPALWSPRATTTEAHVPQLLKSVRLEPVLRSKRSHCSEKPAHHNEE
ncbi:mediator of RNA polymerase II transcription subunit 27 isoform X5 [Pseudorca crassidens]|uniref:mediator of RNA polymerase II transcription subunit 27 isoform X5 n=1 Tax=Pseudorca crassidens TaxID=82174 RepID=UPI00352FCCEA